tara:strand:- start:194 stop:511 length:318 start_codon:yes stop_codon:yes gene_type:complete
MNYIFELIWINKESSMSIDRSNKYVVRAEIMLDEFLDAHEAAPSKSSYNKLTGSYARTKRDLMRDFKNNIAMVEAAYKLSGGKGDSIFDAIKDLPEPDEGNILTD